MRKMKTLLLISVLFVASGSLSPSLQGQTSGGIDCLTQFQQDWLYCETNTCSAETWAGAPFGCMMSLIGCENGALNAYSNCAEL